MYLEYEVQYMIISKTTILLLLILFFTTECSEGNDGLVPQKNNNITGIQSDCDSTLTPPIDSLKEAPMDSTIFSRTYLALGDSYTIGESVQEKERWSVQLTEMLRKEGFKINNPYIIARTGWTTS